MLTASGGLGLDRRWSGPFRTVILRVPVVPADFSELTARPVLLQETLPVCWRIGRGEDANRINDRKDRSKTSIEKKTQRQERTDMGRVERDRKLPAAGPAGRSSRSSSSATPRRPTRRPRTRSWPRFAASVRSPCWKSPASSSSRRRGFEFPPRVFGFPANAARRGRFCGGTTLSAARSWFWPARPIRLSSRDSSSSVTTHDCFAARPVDAALSPSTCRPAATLRPDRSVSG